MKGFVPKKKCGRTSMMKSNARVWFQISWLGLNFLREKITRLNSEPWRANARNLFDTRFEKLITCSWFSCDVTAAILVYRTTAKKVVWEFDSIIMQSLSDILPLFCTPTWQTHHVSEIQELSNQVKSDLNNVHLISCQQAQDVFWPRIDFGWSAKDFHRGCRELQTSCGCHSHEKRRKSLPGLFSGDHSFI